MKKVFIQQNKELVELLESKNLSAFDLIPQKDLREKLVELVLNGVPAYSDYESSILFRQLYRNLTQTRVDKIRVVVFGGGTGLSNIIGGDCRQTGWSNRPFNGIKDLFPETRAIVCVTDDGGSTGELLKDLPVIALGDIRHVLLSSVQVNRLCELYDLTRHEAEKVTGVLSTIFNYRFDNNPSSPEDLINASGADFESLPGGLSKYIKRAIDTCYSNPLSKIIFERAHCLGNIIVLSVFIKSLSDTITEDGGLTFDAEKAETVLRDLSECSRLLGAAEDAVMPSTLTPAQLRFLYTNGVQVTGEQKSSTAQRGYPVDKVFIDFSDKPYVSVRLLQYIRDADILIMAPGSLYSSIIPVLQVPGIAEAVRENDAALKLLISNLWVQAGETDLSITDPERKFHVSDMIRAYDRNLPGGTQGLFDQVLCLSLKDVPGSVLQNYAVEGKIPIYLDREVLEAQGFEPIECGFFSRNSLAERQVIQHDPDIIAKTVKTIYLSRDLLPHLFKKRIASLSEEFSYQDTRKISEPSARYGKIRERFNNLDIIFDTNTVNDGEIDHIRSSLTDIIWNHKDIPISHLDNIKGITCVDADHWRRDQRWDNVFSFYDPEDRQVKIRQDRLVDSRSLEISFLIAVGQALLGNYAEEKKVEKIKHNNFSPGRVFNLHLTDERVRRSYFTTDELKEYLGLARMVWQGENHFTRLVSGEEGFTPPGLLFGVMYAWYLDNSLASYIEYKMSVLKVRQTDLIHEQMKTMKRRMDLIRFFRQTVFGKEAQAIQQ